MDYKILCRVATGSTGIVYRARRHDGRIVAVKRLKAGYTTSRIIHEAHIHAGCDHPNITKLYQLRKRKNGRYELIMEWVGPQLSTLLAHGRLPLAVAVYIAHQIVQALGYLRNHPTYPNLLHRDLSKRNILLTTDGAVKLTDFGLAKSENAPRTTTILRGSPPYISPEQLDGAALDARSDLFAVGVLLYELLAGIPPFQSAAEISLRPDIVPITTYRPDIPPRLAAMVHRLVHYDPDHRYQSIDEAQTALAELLEPAFGPDALAILLAERGLSGHASPNRRRLARGARMTAAALLGAAGMFLYQPTSSTRSTAPAPTESAPTGPHQMNPTADDALCPLPFRPTTPSPKPPTPRQKATTAATPEPVPTIHVRKPPAPTMHYRRVPVPELHSHDPASPAEPPLEADLLREQSDPHSLNQGEK